MGWVRLEVATFTGSVWLEVKVKRDIVEWWLGGRAVAMMDREELGRWLANPVGEFSWHEVTLLVGEWGPAVVIEDRIPLGTLNPQEFQDLREETLGGA